MSSTALTSASTTSQSLSQTAVGKVAASTVAKVLPIAATTTPRKDAQQQHGQWTHPRMDEVIRRRDATSFDKSNVTTILLSSIVLLVSLSTPHILHGALPASWLVAVYPYPRYAVWTIQAVMALNIAVATLPLWRKPDACEDVPLTPQQRKLLGLPPMTRPATPAEKQQHVTPPRFSRSNTPNSRTSSLNATRGASPLSGRGTPIDASGSFRPSHSASHSQWGSPAQGNQLRRTESGNSLLGPETSCGSGGERRRLSYTAFTNSSPLDISSFESLGRVETPTKEKKASVGLNNKWLYERGRGSPSGSARFKTSLPAGSMW
ncbi:Putative nuclear pore complex component [Septoria linicola]|uniref:Nuclear pore complex component n=1 Tax=Septoria linicola TaxID=215465 RepID=A0A9Q9ALY0_9PEZI|nr:Putative nuclear pore complex component [Septoria linicola]